MDDNADEQALKTLEESRDDDDSEELLACAE